MKRSLVGCLVIACVGSAAGGELPVQEGQTPAGYQFFARRHRPTPTAWTRIPDARSTQSTTRPPPCCKTSEDLPFPVSPIPAVSGPVPAGPAATAASESASEPPTIQQTTWGAEFGLGHGWPEEAYYPGASTYPFGRTVPHPLHGYREIYEWAGHTYTMHCYCDQGYCPFHCPGYRDACFVPCWNDGGTLIFESRCGRGSGFDAFWHMGGYERRRRRTDCPYICAGPPAYDSFGFPHGTPGDPNYRKPRGTGNADPWKMSHDPYGTPPAKKPGALPVSPPAPSTPEPIPAPVEPPTPKP